jgi:hypothetical protein
MLFHIVEFESWHLPAKCVIITVHAIKPACSLNGSVPIQADGDLLFLEKVFGESVKHFSDFYISYQREI